MAHAPVTRPTNVDKMLLAGSYWFRRAKRERPVRVEVNYAHGDCVITLEDGTERLAKDIVPGWPNWREHFQQVV